MRQITKRTLRGTAIAAFLAAGIMPTQAQKLSLEAARYEPICKKFSYTGQPQLMFLTEQREGDRTVQIYDENLALKKEITYNLGESKSRVVTEERLVIPGEYDDIVMDEWTGTVDGLDAMIELMNGWGYTSHTKVGNVHTFLPIELPEGGEYRKFVYIEGASEYTEYNIYRAPRYSDWQVTGEENSTYYSSQYVGFYDFDTDIIADDYSSDLNFTQTLFNTDEKYEYLSSVCELSSTPSRIDEIDRIWRPDGDFAIKRRLEYYSNQTATNVVSEDGSVLYTFPGSVDNIIRMGGKLYAVTEEYTGETYVNTFYEIDPTSSSVKAVRTSEVKISPRAVRRSENVTIETGSTDSKVGREVVVTSADGRVIERRSIPAGVTSTQISTARMASGVYNFTVYANGKRLDNGKIIVR